MTRRSRIILCVFLIVFISFRATGQNTIEVSSDSYEVYAALLVQHYGSWLKQKAPLLIYGQTVPAFQGHDPVEKGCRGRAGQDVVLGQLLDKLVLEKRRFRIDSKLKSVGNLRVVSGKVRIEEGQEPGIVYFSTVAFSQNKRVAMAWMSNSCGYLCGAGSLWVLDQKESAWHLRKNQLNCGFIR